MTLRNNPIESKEEAAEWFALLAVEKRFALDLEADGFFSYEDKICLAQFATLDECALVDPLADRECLAPLGPLLADGAIEKIFHGGDYDIRLLKKGYGFAVENLFDTMIASQLLGREPTKSTSAPTGQNAPLKPRCSTTPPPTYCTW